VPQEDFCQLCQRPSADKYKGSLEAASKALAYSRQAGLDAVRFLELNLLAWLMGNADLHLKNFSLYCPEPDRWQLAPAYDLVSTALVLRDDKDETALTLNGKKSRLLHRDWLALSKNMGMPVKVLEKLIKRALDAWPVVETLCHSSLLPGEQQASFLAHWQERAGRLRGE
jgi:serine/threonine-protein kinase HipA